MDEILNVGIGDMPMMEFDCSCGKHHTFPVHNISIHKGAIKDLPSIAAPFKDSRVLVVFDNNTYEVAGKTAVELLCGADFQVDELLFDTQDDILIPDETTLGRIVQNQDLSCGLMVAVGSGVINDAVKFVSSRSKLPYIVVATAPSMDGYVSDGAPIFIQGRKVSPVAHFTYGLIGDTDILQTAPQDLIQAGFGDVVGKITALADWDLSVKVNGDYRCDTCVELVQRALDSCFEEVSGLSEREPRALSALMEALTMTGVAMALLNISRPASGAEHLLSHFWEMDYIARGLNPQHHGLQVGVATPVIARFFEMLHDVLPEGTAELCPSHTDIEELLHKAGLPSSPADIGIPRELFLASLLEGEKVRPRYSVLRFAREKGRLDAIAHEIVDELYGSH